MTSAGSRALLTLNPVSVRVLTGDDARMAQHLRDDVEVRALGQHQGGSGVSQLVQMPMAKTRTSADPGEHMRDVVRVERCANLAREDQAVVLPCLTDSDTVLGLTDPMAA